MFTPLIRDLELEHAVVIICGALVNTIDLFNLHGLSYNVIGIHCGAKPL